MTELQALQLQALAHGSLRRGLRKLIRYWDEEADHADMLMQDADTGRECGYQDGKAQAIRAMTRDLEILLKKDEQSMHSRKGDGEK